ncbi:MAG: hypothetical protein NW224_30450 [Leptolyngbyaceae cyanobacterium bins.302]|nr:hypothetical protein [Leptolyngbyaceae cyanobacterium bins.302]
MFLYGLGISRIGWGIDREKPVGLLVLLVVAAMAVVADVVVAADNTGCIKAGLNFHPPHNRMISGCGSNSNTARNIMLLWL